MSEPMSSSSGFSQISTQRSVSKSPEKRGFVPAVGMPAPGSDLNLGFRRNGSAPGFNHRQEKMANLKSLDLFPQQTEFGISNDGDSRGLKSSTAAPQTSQMTIFYAGQVYVFNDFPAEKVGEVMYLAGSKSSELNITAAAAAGQPALVETLADSLSSTSPVSCRNQTPPPHTVASAVPMARKASIQRFLEKRKDRLTARSPYLSGPAPNKIGGVGENSWLGLAVQPQH